jgi:Fe-S cluster biosynthesis and repair protein YggX
MLAYQATRCGEAAQMARTVQCVRLGEEAEGLDFPPLPGELGTRVFESVSKPAWQQWLAHQTMLINENRLKVTDPEARRFLEGELKKYFFGGGSATPEGYVAPEE